MTGEQVSHYRIAERLGQGGMGVVYAAEDVRLGRRVAIKFLPDDMSANPETVERFLREARAISSLNHPHICTLHDIGAHAGRQYMVMELLEGESLKGRLARGPLPVEEVLLYGEQIADALHAAHSQGIVHRDLKPANLFLTRRGDVKVLDFGVAKLSETPRGGDDTVALTEQLTVAGSTLGTVHYMSPEQARGGDIDARSDIFSLGIVIYEMATGRAPFSGATAAAVFEQIFGGVPPAPSQVTAGVPADLDRVIFRALEKDRELRYQSAADLRADLRRVRKTTDSVPLTGLSAPPEASASSATSAHLRPSASDPSATSAHLRPSASDPSAASAHLRPTASDPSAASAHLRPSEASAASAHLRPPASDPSAASAHLRPSEASAHLRPAAARKTRAWWIAAPVATAVVIAAVLYLRSDGTPALAHRDTVVMADFVNRTGDAVFDDTLYEALGVQLRQSPFLNVLNEQQQQATLRLMGRDDTSPVTVDVGREVCQRNGGKAVLSGTVASLGSSYLLTLAARDCVTGDVLAEEQVQAAGKDEVLGALGRATSRFRERLGESLASIQRYDAPIEMATTPSLDALKQYSQGTVVRRTQGDFDSVPFFEAAIRTDPEFALAYARLGTVLSNLQRRQEAEAMTRTAYDLRERVSERERLYIEARYHSVVTGNVSRAIETYRLLIATYPDDYAAHTNIGSLLKARGDTVGALSALREAVRLAPEQPTGWLNLAFTHLENNEFDDARAGFDRVLKLQDSATARQGLYTLAVATGDEALAAAQVEAVRGRRDEVELMPARIGGAAYRGRFKEAAELLDVWARRMEQSGRSTNVGEGILSFAISEAIVGFDGRARARLAAVKAARQVTPAMSDERLVLAALLGDPVEAKEAFDGALAEAGESPDQLQFQEPMLRALLAMASRAYEEAVGFLSPIAFERRFVQGVTVWSIASHQLRRHEDAIRGLAWLTEPPLRLGLDATLGFALHTLAAEQTALGRSDEARQTRQRLSELWKNADPDIPLLRAASAGPAETTRP